MKIMKNCLKWVQMAWYGLILKLDGALWLRIIYGSPFDAKMLMKGSNTKTNLIKGFYKLLPNYEIMCLILRGSTRCFHQF